MKQKRVTLLALVLILTMCGGNSATTEIVESLEEVETKQSQQEDTQVNREEDTKTEQMQGISSYRTKDLPLKRNKG